MLDGSGEATAAVAPAVAFAFLADPRHAGEWFAGAGFETPPRGPARAGLEWSFARTPGTRRVQPVRMTVYEPPSRFVWETQYRAPLQTNFVFEMACEPVEGEAVEGEEAGSRESTRLRFTIRLRPGVVQWASIAAGFALLRRALRERAQKAAERAAEAVLAAPPAGGSGGKGNATGGSPRRKRRRR